MAGRGWFEKTRRGQYELLVEIDERDGGSRPNDYVPIWMGTRHILLAFVTVSTGVRHNHVLHQVLHHDGFYDNFARLWRRSLVSLVQSATFWAHSGL